MPRQESTADIDWLAFRYVAGELSDQEHAAFELRLADDQPAREAVAAAVELSECVMVSQTLLIASVDSSLETASEVSDAIESSSRPTQRHPPRRASSGRSLQGRSPQDGVEVGARSPSWLRAAGWLAASVAAMFLVMAMVESLRFERMADSQTARGSSESSRSLAAQWSDLRERATDIFDEPAVAWHVDSNEIATGQDPARDDSAEELLSPDWLIAALADEEMPNPDSPRVME